MCPAVVKDPHLGEGDVYYRDGGSDEVYGVDGAFGVMVERSASGPSSRPVSLVSLAWCGEGMRSCRWFHRRVFMLVGMPVCGVSSVGMCCGPVVRLRGGLWRLRRLPASGGGSCGEGGGRCVWCRPHGSTAPTQTSQGPGTPTTHPNGSSPQDPPGPNPAGVAIRYSMYKPGRTGKLEHPYYPLHHSCHTPEHRTQTFTCPDLNPDTAYILHYIYSYLTEGQPEQGIKAMSPPEKHIISKGMEVYATPILQPTTPVAHLTTGLAIYAYLPMNPCRLRQPSPADLLFFTDASGEFALKPVTKGATLQLTQTGGHYHMDHHIGHTTYGASSHGELGVIADAIAEIATHLPAHLAHVVRVLFVMDATADTHLLLRIARKPLHKATATNLGTQALLLWKVLRSLPPYVQLHIVKQESHRHQYGNGKGDIQAVHQRTTHLPTLQVPDLGRTGAPSDPRLGTGGRPLYLTRQIIPLPQPRPTSRPRARQHREPSTHPRAPGETEGPPLPLGTTPSERPSPPPETTHPAPQGATTTPQEGRWMARPQAHPRPGRTHLLPVRPHQPGGVGTLQDMPPPYGQGHISGLVPGRNPTATGRLANPQPRTPGHQTPLQGSPGQGSHFERGGDTGPTPTPPQTHGKPDERSSAPPARSSPQSSSPNGTLLGVHY